MEIENKSHKRRTILPRGGSEVIISRKAHSPVSINQITEKFKQFASKRPQLMKKAEDIKLNKIISSDVKKENSYDNIVNFQLTKGNEEGYNSLIRKLKSENELVKKKLFQIDL